MGAIYQVTEHRYGPKASIGVNGLLWEHSFGGPWWQYVSEHRKKAEAIAACNAHPIHAMVYKAHTSEPLYDNGKPDGDSIVSDARPSKDIPIRAPRSLSAYGLTDLPDDRDWRETHGLTAD